MRVKITPIQIDKRKIDEIARAKGGIIGGLLITSSYIDSVMEYVPAYIYRYLFRGDKASLLKGRISKEGEILLIADSQSMRVGVIEQQFFTSEADISKDRIIKNADSFDDCKVLERIKTLAIKAITIKFRISPHLELLGRETVFRPRWISIYGKEGKETHRLVTPADGFKYIR